MEKLKPIYADLSNEELLSKCLHGKMQNHNECFNSTIWERIPKTRYVGIEKLKLGVCDAIANFNIGRKASVMIYEKMSMKPGRYTTKGCSVQNKRGIYFANYKNKSPIKNVEKSFGERKSGKMMKLLRKKGTCMKQGDFNIAILQYIFRYDILFC